MIMEDMIFLAKVMEWESDLSEGDNHDLEENIR